MHQLERDSIKLLIMLNSFKKFICVLLMLVVSSGCRGGRSVGTNSPGIRITPISNLERLPSGAYRVKPKSIETPSAKPKHIKSEIPSIKYEPKSSIRKPQIVEAKIKEKPLSTAKANLIPPPPNNSDSLIPTLPEGNSSPEVAGPCELSPDKKTSITIKWATLILYYLIVIVFAVGGYLIYKNYKKTPKKRVRRSRKRK